MMTKFAILLIASIGIGHVAGCATMGGSAAQREVASTTRIFIEVQQDTVLAGGLQSEVAGNLRKMILDSKNGVPVTDPSQADMRLTFMIHDVNFTHATRWEWQLVDIESGALVLTNSDTSAFGAGASSLAGEVVEAMNTIDMMAFSDSAASVPVAQPVAPPVQKQEMPGSATPGDNAWAVIIGVESYREQLRDATGAAADASKFADYAKTTLNVPEANIKVLLNDRATRADMSAALLEWLPRNAVEPGGRVYVFFSGHGAPDVESGDGYLMPWDANPTYVKSGGLRVADVQDKLASLQGQSSYLFLDACFSGQGDRSVLAEGTRPIVPVKELKGGVVTFAASKADETTGSNATGSGGLFSHYLLSGLKGAADANSDGNVTIDELRAHVIDNVRVDARRQNRDQTPTVVLPAGRNAAEPIVSALRK